MAQGSIGSPGSTIGFDSAKSIGCTLGANEYPSGTITFNGIGSGAYWTNTNASTKSINLYLCDSAGNNKVFLFTIRISGNNSNKEIKTATINAPGLKGKALYLIAEGNTYNIFLRNGTTVTISTTYDAFNVSCSASTGGSLSASTSRATPGSTVTLYPSASTGYYFTGYTTSPSLSISNNQFTMPAQAVSITANFAKVTYSITKNTSPSGAGTVSGPSSATMGTSVSFSQTPATGYYFNGWTTSPANLGNSFTMPASNVTITARYLRRSIASLNKTTLTGGTSAILSINTENTGYTHKYKLSFGTNMETELTDVAAGVTSVTINIPESWSNQIPNAATKTGGTLVLYTYSGSTQIGSHTLSGLTYAVPASAGPEITSLVTSIARTIGSVTYANVGDHYVQLHCGVRIQAEAESGLSATIATMTAAVSGYSGSNYNGSASDDEIDFTSGLLSIAGETTITVVATDSRGFTATETTTITVEQYNAPTGLLSVRRVDIYEQDDDVGIYAKYALEKAYTQIGTNSLTVTLTSQGSSEVISADTGNVLPNSRQTFSLQQEYTITVTLTDAFETTTITARLRSGRFILFINAGGNKLGFMKATTKAIPTGKDSTIEFSGDSQIYIGEDTLEDYIRNIVQNM